ncbi:hypothetical protein FRB94_003925 [Tulasnella sp. JGI-2019a]|nr:hypothetical protein FRB93_009252 [Tulasnella sp. JGI-2019a]KAG9013091.1 hypothetical protein FRB94_003925 [Tulasnella sp. JGI-2019a]
MVAQSVIATVSDSTQNAPCSSCEPAESPVPTRALLFTQNTTRNPISWNPTLRQPNPNEVLHSVHLALHKALDPCISGSGDACSWNVVDDASCGYETIKEAVPGQKQQVNGIPKDGARILYVPRPSDLKLTSLSAGSVPEVSLKMRFYEPQEGVDRRAQVDEALKSFQEATGLHQVDRFVIGFDGIRWAGGDEECTSGAKDIDSLTQGGIWEHISRQSLLQTIGVSDFSCFHLSRFLSQLPTSDTPNVRRPKINQLNFDRELPEPLDKLAKAEGIELQSHSDNRVPYQGIETLLTEFQKQLPLPSSYAERLEKGLKAIEMHWVLKYTILLKDRGLVADKGYILSFSFKP